MMGKTFKIPWFQSPPIRLISSTTIIDPEFYPIVSHKTPPFLWVKLKSPMASRPRTPHVVFIASGHRSFARSKTEGIEASSRSKRLAEASAVAVILDEMGQAKVHESHSPSKSLKLQVHITSIHGPKWY
jgi:hypothetical protein